MTDALTVPTVTETVARSPQPAPATLTAATRFDASMIETSIQKAGAAAKAGDVATRFEAAFLAPLVTEILPPADSSVWGGGPGKLWRGLFAEEVARALADGGGVGIAPIIQQAMAAKQEVTQ